MVSKKEEVQKKSERKATPRREYEGESIGMFLAWMALYWMFTCILAFSLLESI